MALREVEIIVVDGGSSDATFDLAQPLCDRVILAPCGRAMQMNAGAAQARGDNLLFLHADTSLPNGAIDAVKNSLQSHSWGRFDVHLDSAHPLLRVVETMMNARSRFTGIATGDQAIFVRRDAFEAVGRFAELPLMEDIDLSVKLRKRGPSACLHERVVTSARRWESRGVLRTIALMWGLRAAYFFGVPPATLARWYR